MTRIYLPGTMRDLARLREVGVIPGGFTAHAVTPALREWYAESDTEELEHAAFLEAERRSLQHLADDPSAVRLRVVVAADVPDSSVGAAGGAADRGEVRVQTELPLTAVVSVHIDEAEAEADVAAAVIALPDAAGGDEDAQFVVDSAEGRDLLWYDVTELDDVLLLEP
jgi:hypothetical protein